jgi:hypothetical protein
LKLLTRSMSGEVPVFSLCDFCPAYLACRRQGSRKDFFSIF